MTKPLVDTQSRNTIKTDLASNQLVEAGAGSGKTQMMAERMAAGVANGAYDVEHMAAVTFTVKAAAELRGRFQLALETELKNSAGDVERAARVRSALSHIERFFAGTIHSFCAHLLRERPVEAGVSPGFTELDEVEDTRLRRQSWRDYRSQLKSAGDPLILEMLAIGARPADLDSAFDTVCLYEEVEFPGGTASVPDAKVAWAALETFWKALEKKLPSRIDSATTCTTQQRARTFRRRWGVAERNRSKAQTLVPLLETWNSEPKVVQKWWAEGAAEKKRIAAEITDLHGTFRANTVQPFIKAWRQYVYRLSVELLSRARAYAAAERRRLNTLNYGDLLQLAARVLRENGDVRRALAEKYRWLFVDEFQDTDPVQAEIMFLLAADGSRESGTGSRADWRTVDLRPGALFVVGDPKQSIYRFRRADIDIYNEVRARLEAMPNGKVVSLTSNFRSAAVLCELANDVFSKQFPATPTTQSPMFARLEPARTKVAGQQGLFTLTTPDTVEKSDISEYEAAAMARFVQAEVAAGRRAYGDFLILLRKKKDMEVYARAFEEQQIPIEVSGAGAFGDSREVLQLALLLRAIADPQDGVSLVGVLRGALFGLSDRDLFSYRQAGGWFSIFTDGPKSGLDSVTRVSAALATLRQFHRWTQVMPIAAAVERILERTGYLALAATTPGGVEAGDLIHAVDRIRTIVEDGFTLADAADALMPDADESSDVESLPLEPGRNDVVRLMNLHKAKGLEAPVVFLANPFSGVSTWVDVRVVREADKARGYFKIEADWGEFGKKPIGEPEGWEQHSADESLYIQAEEQRLLYVAATRAKDMLVISRWGKAAGGRRPWEIFDPFLGKATELKIPASVNPPATQVVDLSASTATAAITRAQDRHLHAVRGSWTTATVSEETKHLPKPSPVADPDDPTGVVTADTPTGRVDAGTAWGSLIHGLLEHALRHQDVTAADLRRLAMWMTMETPELRPVVDEAVATVQSMSAKEFWVEAKASAECHEEVPFAIKVAGDGGLPKVINGTIDSVYQTADGWKIVDYKTDVDVTPAMLQARYSDQLKAYAGAWQRFTDAKVTPAIVDARVKPKA
jgi:ATP-dependent helicase/nuclease subunit A